MRGGKLLWTLLIVGALMAVLVTGCGSDSSDTSSSSSASTTSTPTSDSSTAANSTNRPQGEEASKEFIKPGKENGTAEFGLEADEAEREAASAVLEESMQARESGDWEGQCATMSAEAIALLAKSSSNTPGGCEQDLEKLGQPLAKTKPFRANTMTGPIAALRVSGNKGFALYHGTKGVNYAMPMTKDDGEWKVLAIQEQELP